MKSKSCHFEFSTLQFYDIRIQLLLVTKNHLSLIVRNKRIVEGYWPFTYYWPMSNDTVSSHAMYDKGQSQIQADLHNVKFIHVPRLVQAASLEGDKQWIDIDAGKWRIHLFLTYFSLIN